MSGAELGAQVRLAQAGDRDACAYLVAATHAGALRMARSVLADPSRAEDAVQEAYLLAFQRLALLRQPDAFRGWLGVIVRREAVRLARRRGPDLLESPDARPDEAGQAPPQGAGAAELRRLVRDAVEGLTPATREVSEQYYLRGRSLAETAELLGLPPGTVKRRLHEARERLRGPLAGLAGAAPLPHPNPPRRRPLRRPL